MIIFHGGGNRTEAGRQDLNIEKKKRNVWICVRVFRYAEKCPI